MFIKINTSLAQRASLPLLLALPAQNSLFPGTRAELALPPDRWMTSQRLTLTRHQDTPEGGLRPVLGWLPTPAPG